MINASLALATSNTKFEEKYQSEILFVESKIWEVVNEGFISVWIKSSEGNWVGESETQTNRMINYFKEQGFKVAIIGDCVDEILFWKDVHKGILISWG